MRKRHVSLEIVIQIRTAKIRVFLPVEKTTSAITVVKIVRCVGMDLYVVTKPACQGHVVKIRTALTTEDAKIIYVSAHARRMKTVNPISAVTNRSVQPKREAAVIMLNVKIQIMDTVASTIFAPAHQITNAHRI